MPPGRKVAVVVCMDARIDPAGPLVSKEGDAHVIRNAGGRAGMRYGRSPFRRSCQGTREIVVIHHTDCGMLAITNDVIRRSWTKTSVPRQVLPRGRSILCRMSGCRREAEERDRSSRQSPLILRGYADLRFIFDVTTGRIEQVV